MGSCLVGGWASNAKRLLNHRNGDQKMNQAERQALREKHRWTTNNEGDDRCIGCFSYEYPCDAIKVLEDYELLEKQYQIIFQLNQELIRSEL